MDYMYTIFTKWKSITHMTSCWSTIQIKTTWLVYICDHCDLIWLCWFWCSGTWCTCRCRWCCRWCWCQCLCHQTEWEIIWLHVSQQALCSAQVRIVHGDIIKDALQVQILPIPTFTLTGFLIIWLWKEKEMYFFTWFKCRCKLFWLNYFDWICRLT